MKSQPAFAVLLLLALGPVSPAVGQQPEVLVSAAASLTDVLTGLQAQADRFVGAQVLFNFGGSGALRKQIEEGAPVDLFFSASLEDLERLQAEGLLLAGSRKDLLSNRIVLIGGPGSAQVRDSSHESLEALRTLLSKADLLAIGNPDTVPAGRYAVRALTAYGLFSLVKGKLALGGNVREVLQYVQNGSAPLGIVFATDLLAALPGSVSQIFAFPDEGGILYSVAAVKASKNREKALQMIEFLESETARNAFRSAGFILK